MRGKRPREVAWALLAAAWLALGSACSVSSDLSRELGARCDSLDECAERCLDGARYPGGFCSVSCDGDDDCPDRASCADLEGGVCLYACDDATDCEFLGPGWQCRAEPGTGAGQVMVCVGPG
ncbi:MAG TPA: hypothetical protein VNO33_06950 [Kofleriaceae bacterium]|nr:hypothetical protein [Kofleriaceae bacterium]